MAADGRPSDTRVRKRQRAAATDVLTTLAYRDEPAWMSGTTLLDRDRCTKSGRVLRLYRAAGRYRTLVLDGASRWEQLSAVAIARRRRPPRIVLVECTWKRGRGAIDRLACRLGSRAMDGPHLTYGVISSDEVTRFPRTWGVDPRRVVYTPFCATLTRAELAQPTTEGHDVFAGGNSMRDYETLLAVARKIPGTFVVATHLLDGRRDVPDNVSAGPLSHGQFVARLRDAAVVVVPLPGGLERSAGQQTYLNAMAYGKPVIVSDAPGVRDHIEHRRTGLVVPPEDPERLAAAVEWVLDPQHRDEVRAMAARGRQEVRGRFLRAHYVERVLDVVAALAEGQGATRTPKPGG
jgi:hypothetical protein